MRFYGALKMPVSSLDCKFMLVKSRIIGVFLAHYKFVQLAKLRKTKIRKKIVSFVQL